jgi:acyl carrier protein
LGQNSKETEAKMNIKQQICEFIIEDMLFGDKTKLSENVPFQDSGIMDSMGLLSLIHFVEDRFGIEIADNELVPEHMDSVENISTLVEKKLAEKEMVSSGG